MSTLIASLANLAIRTAKCTKDRLRDATQAVLLVLGKADWTIKFGA
jgi:hypothetical protein